MIVEAKTFITRKEFTTVGVKVFYKQLSAKLLLLTTIPALIVMVLHWPAIFTIHTATNVISLGIIIMNLFMPFHVAYVTQKQYTTNKTLKYPVTYVLNDDRIYYKSEGSEGNITWGSFLKYDVIKGFIYCMLHPGG